MAVANVLVSLEVRIVLVGMRIVSIPYVNSAGFEQSTALVILCVFMLSLAFSDDSLVSRRIGGMPLFAWSNGKCRNRRHSTCITWCGVRDRRRSEAARRNRQVDIWSSGEDQRKSGGKRVECVLGATGEARKGEGCTVVKYIQTMLYLLFFHLVKNQFDPCWLL
jgi:hypothetical protein